jgi:DNA repair protein RecO (recombination protein O)
VPLYRDEAVVLRVQKLGEADRIVTLLTRRHGRVRAVGKGVRRTSSRFGARLEPGSHIDVQLHTRLAEGQAAPGGRRGLDLVTQTESLGAYGAQLATDYSAWTAVSAICETAERLTEEGEPALRLYLLLVGALKALVERAHQPPLVLDAFLVRAMATAGWQPALEVPLQVRRDQPARLTPVPRRAGIGHRPLAAEQRGHQRHRLPRRPRRTGRTAPLAHRSAGGHVERGVRAGGRAGGALAQRRLPPRVGHRPDEERVEDQLGVVLVRGQRT